MDVHALGSDDGDDEGTDIRPHYRQHPSRTRSPRSGLNDFEGYSSKDEVKFLISPSWRGYVNPSRKYRRNYFTSNESDDLSDSDLSAEVNLAPCCCQSINSGRKVTFALTQSASAASHTTISGGHQSSVGGSQRIIADHRYRQTDVTNNYGLVGNVNIHIHVGTGDSKTLVFSIGLFGRGDSTTMRCT